MLLSNNNLFVVNNIESFGFVKKNNNEFYGHKNAFLLPKNKIILFEQT